MHTVVIDSRHKDKAYDNSEYVAILPQAFHHVKKVELGMVTLPRGIENIICLNVDEFQSDTISSNSYAIDECFAIIPVRSQPDNISQFLFPGINCSNHSCEFSIPIKTLSQLKISWNDLEGNLVDVGDHIIRFDIHT